MRFPRRHYGPLSSSSCWFWTTASLWLLVVTIIIGSTSIQRITCFSPLRPVHVFSSRVRHDERRRSRRSTATDHPHDADDDEPVATTTTTTAVTFDDLGLDPRVARAVRHGPSGWIRPTPVQQYAIPPLVALDSNNNSNSTTVVWCEAPTGSGKTAAYVLPLLHHQLLWNQNHRNKLPKQQQQQHNNKKDGFALILCPTRELVLQITQVVQELASHVGVDSTHNNNNKSKKRQQRPSLWKIVALYGGVPRAPQLAELLDALEPNDKKNVIVVATPGRLVDVLTYYDQRTREDDDDDALEQKLLEAMDRQQTNRLTLEDITKLQLLDGSTASSKKKNGEAAQEQGRVSLSNWWNNLDYLILDEADRLLGRGFESEMQGVLDLLPKTTSTAAPSRATSATTSDDESSSSSSSVQTQTWLFSATFPKALEPRMNAMLKQIHPQLQQQHADDDDDQGAAVNMVRIACTQSDRREPTISATLSKKLEQVIPPNRVVEQVGPASTIEQRVYCLPHKRDRTQALRYLLNNNNNNNNHWDRVLVFVATRYASEHVSRKLRRAGFTATAELHGKLEQPARERRLRDFANNNNNQGMPRVLIATDLAARGLDIFGLPCVIHYDLPRSTVDFVHRCGRTGRAGRPGTVVTLLTPQDEAHFALMEERHLVEPVPRQTLDPFPIDPDEWRVAAEASRQVVLAHDRMHGGIKGRRKSKKDKLREAQAAAAAAQQQQQQQRE